MLLQNQFDSIDLSDNSIVRLEGFPKLPRLQCLHLNNNRINRIARGLEGACVGWQGLGTRRRAGRAGGQQRAVCVPKRLAWLVHELARRPPPVQRPCPTPNWHAPALPPAAEAIPRLEWLILTNNRLTNLAVSWLRGKGLGAGHA